MQQFNSASTERWDEHASVVFARQGLYFARESFLIKMLADTALHRQIGYFTIAKPPKKLLVQPSQWVFPDRNINDLRYSNLCAGHLSSVSFQFMHFD